MRISEEKKAESYLIKLFHGSRKKMHCPRCGWTDIEHTKREKLPFLCRGCFKSFSVRTGTIMERDSAPLSTWAAIIKDWKKAGKYPVPLTAKMARQQNSMCPWGDVTERIEKEKSVASIKSAGDFVRYARKLHDLSKRLKRYEDDVLQGVRGRDGKVDWFYSVREEIRPSIPKEEESTNLKTVSDVFHVSYKRIVLGDWSESFKQHHVAVKKKGILPSTKHQFPPRVDDFDVPVRMVRFSNSFLLSLT